MTGSARACKCKDGFEGDGKTCTDIDECKQNRGGCHANADCKNHVEPGRLPECLCRTDYVGDGKTCVPNCGDAKVVSTEVCDDGNTVSETACPYNTATCVACNADCSGTLSLMGPYCGDALINGPEQCDDGNRVNETACAYGTRTCTRCNANCSAALSLVGPYCGDSLINGTETCDDGKNSGKAGSCAVDCSRAITCASTRAVDQAVSEQGTFTFSGGAHVWQSFTAGRTGYLNSLRIYHRYRHDTQDVTITFRIRSGEGASGTILQEETRLVPATTPFGWHDYAVGINLQLLSGTIYTWQITSPIEGHAWLRMTSTTDGINYAGGRSDGGLGSDWVFQTYLTDCL